MAQTLDDLTTPVTTDEVKAVIYSVLAGTGVDTTTWKPGAVVRTIIAGVAIVTSAFSRLQALIAKSGWLELAEGAWLALVALHVFDVEKELATFATGVITLTNGGGGVFDADPGDLVVRNSSTDKTYRNDEAIHLGANQTLTDIPITAIEAGADSTSAGGEIDELETPWLNVTVTNPDAVVGLDEQSDPELRTVCLEKRSALSPNGPRDAYSFFAKKSVRADGTKIGVTRVKVTKSSETGNVTVTVATPTGGVTGDVLDAGTDLGAIDVYLKQNVVPDGVTQTTQSASPASIAVTYEAWAYSSVNLTTDEIAALIEARLVTFMTTQPIGGNVIDPAPGKVFVDAIRTTIGATRPEIFHVVVTSPPADVVLDDADVPMLGTVTPTSIHKVSPP